MDLATLIYFVVLILSIILHEVAHGYAANALGDPTARLAGRLTLNPLPHIDPVGSIIVPLLGVLSPAHIFFGWAKPVPYNPYNLKNRRWAEAAVALAGSVTNLALAVLFGLLAKITSLPASATTLFLIISLVNLFLGVFNLIPFPPLDGFTAIRALVPWRLGRHLEKFEYSLRGMGALSLLLFLFIFSQLLIGPFSTLVVWLFSLITG